MQQKLGQPPKCTAVLHKQARTVLAKRPLSSITSATAAPHADLICASGRQRVKHTTRGHASCETIQRDGMKGRGGGGHQCPEEEEQGRTPCGEDPARLW